MSRSFCHCLFIEKEIDLLASFLKYFNRICTPSHYKRRGDIHRIHYPSWTANASSVGLNTEYSPHFLYHTTPSATIEHITVELHQERIILNLILLIIDLFIMSPDATDITPFNSAIGLLYISLISSILFFHKQQFRGQFRSLRVNSGL